MKPRLLVSASLLSLAFCATATSAAVYPANPSLANNALATISPYRGTYYDAAKGGTGIQVDVGASGAAFVTYYSYTSTGAATFYILQEVYHASDEVTRWQTGPIGTMSGTFYSAQGGECLGCAYTPATPTFTNEQATLEWVNSREVKMTVGSQSWDFVAPNLDGQSDGDYLTGNWVVHVLKTYNISHTPGSAPTLLHDNYATVRIGPSNLHGVIVASTAPAGLTSVGPDARWFSWACNERYSPPNAPTLCQDTLGLLARGTGGAMTFWYDPASNRMGADLVQAADHKIGSINTHVDLYLMTPDFIVGRGITEGTATNTQTFGADFYYGTDDGALNLEVIMQRIPEAAYGGNAIR